MDTRQGFALALFLSALCVATAREDAEFWLKSGQERLARILGHNNNVRRARNVILFIGDGMGVNSVTAARIYQGQRHGGHGEDYALSFERFPSLGLAKTYNVDKQVPDSAATATAILSGVKVKYNTLGLDPSAAFNACDPIGDPARRLTGLAHWAQAAGKATGIVTTTRVTHATPAAVYAHANHRDWECDGEIPTQYKGCAKDIARQLVENDAGRNLRVILGGGQRQMGVSSEQDEDNSCTRSDGRNLVQEWMKGKRNAGLYVNSSDSLMAVDVSKVDYLLGLFSPGHIPYVAERGPEHPSLVNMTIQAIRLLQKNKKGFFLMVEAGRIDHAHHKNLAKLALRETCELDETVATAVSLTDPKNTLIIVTADHSHSFTINGYPARGNDILGYANKPNKTKYETITYANGPGFLYHRSNSSGNDTWRDITSSERLDPRYPHMASVYLKDETHGGEDVAVYSTGPHAHLLSGVFEQNYIAHAVAYAAAIGPSRPHLKTTSAGQNLLPFGSVLFFVILLRCLLN